MPIYESDETTDEDLDKLRRKSICAECGERLDVFMDIDKHLSFLACHNWTRSHHEGIEREPSRYEKGGAGELTIEKRREIMTQEHGGEKIKALGRYMGGVSVMTKDIAVEIVNALWGNAPPIEKAKCVLLCQTYQLNPLMKHIYLIGYKRNANGKPVLDSQGKQVYDWSIQMGIGATRLLAQRKHHFSYLDMTPRKATQAEVEKILGDTADPYQVYGFVHIRDQATGAEAFGLRGIAKEANIKGVEKGNTPLNMACIRAERLALDRQYPGEMPPNVEVVDERYLEGEYNVLPDDKPEAITASEVAPELPPPAPEKMPEKHWCDVHNCEFDKKTRGSSTWYAHKLPGGKYCNEAKQKEKAATPTPKPKSKLLSAGKCPECGVGLETVNEETTACPGCGVIIRWQGSTPFVDKSLAEGKPARDIEAIKTISELQKALFEDFHLQPKQQLAELNLESWTDLAISPAEAYIQVAASR